MADIAPLPSSRWPALPKISRHPPEYFKACLLVSLGGLLNGLDTSTIGPVITMPNFDASFGPFSPFLEGFIVSSILIPCMAFSLLSAPISDSLGRASAIALGALAFAAGAAIEASAVALPMFIAGRCIAGAGQGIFLSVVIVYVCEIAPPRQRGMLTTGVQLLITTGLCVGFFTCYGTVRIAGSLSWRLPLALQSSIALSLSVLAKIWLPESPRWLAQKGRRIEASRAWDTLGVSAAEREKDLLENPVNDIPTEETPTNLPFKQRLLTTLHFFRTILHPTARRPLFLGVFLMAMQQLSGIDGVIYYAPLLFTQAGLSSSQASFLASGVSAICIFVFTILAVWAVDRTGRRTSTISGGLCMLACMSVMGILYATGSVHPDRGVGKWIVIVTIYVFSVTYSVTWAMGLKLFASEIQPAKTRATASSLAMFANCGTNFLVAFITPVMLRKSTSAAYWLFAGCLALTVAVGWVYMPETRGVELEAIGEAFGMQGMGEVKLRKAIKGVRRWVGRRMRWEGETSRVVETRDVELERI